jgi:flagellar basal-body rod protein FlgB
MRTSREGHMRGSAPMESVDYRISENPDSETTINGNSVVLEDQMVRANENRMRYETALSIYQKNINLLRTALRPPGR